jgi:hypothetical protein
MTMMWKVEYEQYGEWHPMEFQKLRVDPHPAGLILGEGKDSVGRFSFKGTFNFKKPECRIVKEYLGKHLIHYFGTWDKDTQIILGGWGHEKGAGDGGFRMTKM